MEKNKTGKYLKYAIGEIVLVVIGILIALSINNWNESIKEKALEKKVLVELKKSLENNYSEMLQDSLRRVNWNRSSDIIISILHEKAEYNHSLNIHFHNARLPGTNLSLSTAGYEGLKNVGYNIISSDFLRNSIVELFEISQKNLLEEMEYFESFQTNRQTQVDQLFSYELNKFDSNNPFSVPISPHNYNALVDDIIYLAMVKSVKVQRNIIGAILIRNLEETKNVLTFLNAELESMEN
tara:strand:- start:1311 stop:2027 length:717 start_codon:yes stop_codon:yes gene_type:complete